MSISPLNIIAAAIIMQFSIIVIVFIGSTIISLEDPYILKTYLLWIVISFFVISIGCLLISDQLANIWAPLFGGKIGIVIPWTISVMITFIINVLIVSAMVNLTGSSMHSPFTPIYFILPALSIFLREPEEHVILYLLLIIMFFTANMHFRDNLIGGKFSNGPRNYSYWIVSIACLLLATGIGYLTRPR